MRMEAAMAESPVLKTINMVSTEGVAEAAGLKVGSVRVMAARAKKRREADRSLPTDLPAPDFYIFRSPLWRKSTVNKWLKARRAAHMDTPAKEHARHLADASDVAKKTTRSKS